jgi:hypothetical protein
MFHPLSPRESDWVRRRAGGRTLMRHSFLDTVQMAGASIAIVNAIQVPAEMKIIRSCFEARVGRMVRVVDGGSTPSVLPWSQHSASVTANHWHQRTVMLRLELLRHCCVEHDESQIWRRSLRRPCFENWTMLGRCDRTPGSGYFCPSKKFEIREIA